LYKIIKDQNQNFEKEFEIGDRNQPKIGELNKTRTKCIVRNGTAHFNKRKQLIE
jgi:hypothetical protein